VALDTYEEMHDIERPPSNDILPAPGVVLAVSSSRSRRR
jgi:hypothetical protein